MKIKNAGRVQLYYKTIPEEASETSNKVSSSKLHDYFINKTFLELENINNSQCGKLSFYITLSNDDDKNFEIQPYRSRF
jgi:hypothetical protein